MWPLGGDSVRQGDIVHFTPIQRTLFGVDFVRGITFRGNGRSIVSVSHLCTKCNRNSRIFSAVCSYIAQNVHFALSGSGKESFNRILDPDADPDHHQNLITSKLGQV